MPLSEIDKRRIVNPRWGWAEGILHSSQYTAGYPRATLTATAGLVTDSRFPPDQVMYPRTVPGWLWSTMADATWTIRDCLSLSLKIRQVDAFHFPLRSHAAIIVTILSTGAEKRDERDQAASHHSAGGWLGY